MLGHLLKPEKKPEKEDKKMSADSGSDNEDEENKKGKGEEESKEKSKESQDGHELEDEEEDRMLVFKDMNGQLWQISKVEEDIENFDELLQEAEPEVNYFKPGTTNQKPI